MGRDREKLILASLIQQCPTIPSSSTSSSEDEILIESDDDTRFRKTHVKINNFFEEIVPLYSDEDFKRHFRMTKSAIRQLCGLLQVDKNYRGGWPEISKEKAVHITLWYLANTNTFREVADRFNITDSACHGTVKYVTELIKGLSSTFIKLPDPARYQEVSETFSENGGLPYAIGIIDCTHLEIPRPKENQDYYNRKSYYSIILQAVVNHDKTFADIYIGEPGSLHDCRVLRRSPLYQKFESQNSPYPYYILADSAYPPSSMWLVPPFKDNGHLSVEERHFNQRLSSKRIIVENAFGLLKGRFRRLTRFNNISVDMVINCSVAAAVLHNFCILSGDGGDDIEPELNEIENANLMNPNNIVGRRQELFNMLYP